MKKFILSLVLGVGLCSSSLWAAVSNLNESVRAIEAVIKSPEINQYFRQNDSIEEIIHNENGFLVRTETQEMVVDVIDIQRQGIGPKQFRLVFHPPVPR